MQHQNSWSNQNGPNQSKSFKILQKITDTNIENEIQDDQPMVYQQPHYARPLGPNDMNENQLRKLQISQNQGIIHT